MLLFTNYTSNFKYQCITVNRHQIDCIELAVLLLFTTSIRNINEMLLFTIQKTTYSHEQLQKFSLLLSFRSFILFSGCSRIFLILERRKKKWKKCCTKAYTISRFAFRNENYTEIIYIENPAGMRPTTEPSGLSNYKHKVSEKSALGMSYTICQIFCPSSKGSL